jgi:hypothetical protein
VAVEVYSQPDNKQTLLVETYETQKIRLKTIKDVEMKK